MKQIEEMELDTRWQGMNVHTRQRMSFGCADPMQIEHTLARRGSEKLWKYLNTEDYINALGALTGNQAMQQVKAGLKAIYLSGWQVAADANLSGNMYPDQSFTQRTVCQLL